MIDAKTRKIAYEACMESYPLVFLYIAIYSLQSVNVSLLSLKEPNPKLRDGLGITNLYVNCLVYSIGTGIIYGIDALGSSAFALKQYYLFGLYVHRGRICSLIYLFFIAIFTYYFNETIFSFLGVDNEILIDIQSYIPYAMIAMVFEFLFYVNFRMMYILECSAINTYILIITFLLHFLWVKIFVELLGLSIIGIGIAIIITKILNFLLSTLYLYYLNPFPSTFFKINSDCFLGLKDYMKVAGPTALFFVGEWGGFELQAIMSLLYSEFDYSIHLIMYSIDFFIVNFGMAFGSILGIKLANAVVEERTDEFYKIFKIYTVILYLNIFVIIAFLFIFRTFIISLFSANEYLVQQKGEETLLILFLFEISNSGLELLSFSLRGIAIVNESFISTIINSYFIQVIFSIIFCFRFKLGVKGNWIGMFLGTLIVSIYLLIILWKLNLSDLKEKIMSSIEHDKKVIQDHKIELMEILKK